MKKIKFTCPHCASILRVPGHLAGVSGPCPKCATTITAPSKSEESIIEVAPVKNSSALVSAITGSGADNATATLPPPVKPLQGNRQRAVAQPDLEMAKTPPPVESVVEAGMAQPEYAPAPSMRSPVAEKRIPVSAPTSPSQYEIPADPRPVSPGSYAEPVLHEPVQEVHLPVATPPPLEEEPVPEPPIVEPPIVEKIVVPVPPPLEEGIVSSPPVLEEPVPDDVVEADLSVPPARELEVPLGEPLVPELKEAPKIAIPKTQPIQIKKASTVLPPDRNEVEIEPTPPPGPPIDLPRLDVSLADAGTDTASDLQQYQQKEPTRIQLPQLDDEGTGGNSLDDFTATPEQIDPQESAAEIPKSNTESIPLPPENNLEYAPPSPAVEIPTPVVEAPASFVPPDPSTAAALEQQLMQELSGTHPPIEEARVEEMEVQADPDIGEENLSPNLEIDSTPAAQEEETEPEFDREPVPLITQPDLHEPEEISPTNEGSMANMLGIAESGNENGLSSDLGLESVPRSEGRPSQKPVRDRSMPVEEPVPAPLTPVQPSESDSELDVFDELLGRSAPGDKVGAPWVAMGAIVISVAIVAAIMMYILWHSFGGGSPHLVETDKVLLDQKYSIISSGSSGETPAEKLEAVNSLDMSLPAEKKAPPEGEKGEPIIEKEVIDPPAINKEVKSSITLPGDGSKVLISDGGGETANSPPPKLGAIPDSGMPPTLSVSDTSDPSEAKVKDPGVEAYNKQLEGGENTLSALDSRLAQMSGDAGDPLDDAPAIQDPPARSKPSAPAAAQRSVDPSSGFPAPTADDPPLGKTREVIDAFIRSQDWQSRIPYIYQGKSLRPDIEDYYKKWPFNRADKFSVQLFQMEQDESLGGPYWVYLVSTSDSDAGFPVIVRVENGKLKVDWEIYSEFQDKHFVRFRDGTIASPHNFRVVLEQKSDYFGKDRDAFKDRKDYLCFEVSPPYGNPGEFSQYAFVKKGTALATQLNKNIGLGEDLLAVVVTLDFKQFAHGKRHMVITKWVTEGWFQ